MKTFKALGLLLTYPEGSLYKGAADIVALLRQESILPEKHIKHIEAFLTHQQQKDLLEAQEDYVETFDRGRAHCLHLFEHIHGESRDRGQAMVDLSDTYASKGLYINNNELPDYLPLFMEYLSRCPFDEARALLGDAIDIIAMIGTKLKKRQSPYSVIITAIVALSASKPNQGAIKQALENTPRDPETLDELDEEWHEAAAFSGDPVADCNTCNAFPNASEALKKMTGDAP